MSLPWRITLFVSLALNLLVVGAVVGALAAGARIERGGEAERPMASQSLGPRVFLLMLPADVRREVRAELVRTWRNAGEEREAARAARQEALAALAAEPYDPARLDAAFARMREADAALAQTFHAAVARTLSELTPEQRAAAAEALTRPPPGERIRERLEDWREQGALTPEERRERRQEFREKLRERTQ